MTKITVETPNGISISQIDRFLDEFGNISVEIKRGVGPRGYLVITRKDGNVFEVHMKYAILDDDLPEHTIITGRQLFEEKHRSIAIECFILRMAEIDPSQTIGMKVVF